MARPKKAEGEAGTRQIRVNDDLADMLGWIAHFEKTKVAMILDPWIRDLVVERYAPWAPAVKAIEEAELKAAQQQSAKSRRKK